VTDHPDYYAEARGIAVALFERGETDWSDRIEEAIEGGATATEILMRLRHTLRELLRSGVAPGDQPVEQLVRQLDDVLR
jgi:hypothetical protein